MDTEDKYKESEHVYKLIIVMVLSEEIEELKKQNKLTDSKKQTILRLAKEFGLGPEELEIIGNQIVN